MQTKSKIADWIAHRGFKLLRKAFQKAAKIRSKK